MAAASDAVHPASISVTVADFRKPWNAYPISLTMRQYGSRV
jgi:hypothetical protein